MKRRKANMQERESNNGGNGGKANSGMLRLVRPQAVKLSQESLVRLDYLDPNEKFPLVIHPVDEHLNLPVWVTDNRAFIETKLLEHGAILFRDFKLDTVRQFDSFARAISPALLDYQERAAPRTEVESQIYTSTEYPAEHAIPLHHEMSYSHNWPKKILFYCAQPASAGGNTPIAPDRKVFQRLDPAIKARFIEKKVMYIRNFGEGVDITWQNAFQTTDRLAVENYCRNARTDFEWRAGDRLRTRQVRQAVVRHPVTGEIVWFNHAHMFHLSNLDPSVRESLLAEFKDDELPRNAFYGDGSRIEASVLDEVRAVYRECAVTFPWRRNDVLLLDNFLSSHGREPFTGPRKILVAMAELFTNQEIF
ncbi:MAG: TauD/TfdA family dioxygenase [Acidobacteriota bacterium]